METWRSQHEKSTARDTTKEGRSSDAHIREDKGVKGNSKKRQAWKEAFFGKNG